MSNRRKNRHRGRFRRYGRSIQLIISSVEDLAVIPGLDPALWVATGGPVTCMNGDPCLLALIDEDGNGRITSGEVSRAVVWLINVLSEYRGIDEKRQSVRESDLNLDDPDGKRIAAAMGKIKARFDSEIDDFDLETVRRIITENENQPASGAEVVLPIAGKDPEVRKYLEKVVRVTGGAAHPDGSAGVDSAILERFRVAEIRYKEWRAQAPSEVKLFPDESVFDDGLMILTKKLDEFYALCALAESTNSSPPPHTDWEGVSHIEGSTPDAIMARVAAAPLAPVNQEGVFALGHCSNAFYRNDIADFFSRIISPLAGQPVERIDREEWQGVRTGVTNIVKWIDSKPDLADNLAAEANVDEVVEDRVVVEIQELIESSKAAAIDLANVRLIEKLIVFQMNILNLVNNFVSFPDLYSRERRAAFEKGYLIMDGRRFNLAVQVADRSAHLLHAKNANMFVVYASVFKESGKILYEVAVPVTAGRRGNLAVGKQGIFFDLAGNELAAIVTEIIENPISVSEAIVSPFRRLGRMVTGKVESITQEAQTQLNSFATGNVDAFTAQAAPSSSRGSLLGGGGILLGGSVAFAAIGSAIVYITSTLSQLTWWQFLAGIFGAVALVVLPATVLAIIKLRRRDLSAIIEASGWSVNARMRLTHQLGRRFTLRPDFPKGSKGVPPHRRRR